MSSSSTTRYSGRTHDDCVTCKKRRGRRPSGALDDLVTRPPRAALTPSTSEMGKSRKKKGATTAGTSTMSTPPSPNPFSITPSPSPTTRPNSSNVVRSSRSRRGSSISPYVDPFVTPPPKVVGSSSLNGGKNGFNFSLRSTTTSAKSTTNSNPQANNNNNNNKSVPNLTSFGGTTTNLNPFNLTTSNVFTTTNNQTIKPTSPNTPISSKQPFDMSMMSPTTPISRNRATSKELESEEDPLESPLLFPNAKSRKNASKKYVPRMRYVRQNGRWVKERCIVAVKSETVSAEEAKKNEEVVNAAYAALRSPNGDTMTATAAPPPRTKSMKMPSISHILVASEAIDSVYKQLDELDSVVATMIAGLRVGNLPS